MCAETSAPPLSKWLGSRARIVLSNPGSPISKSCHLESCGFSAALTRASISLAGLPFNAKVLGAVRLKICPFVTYLVNEPTTDTSAL